MVTNGQADAWKTRSKELAKFTLDLLINRNDCYGAYRPVEGEAKGTTQKKRLTLSVLTVHYLGETPGYAVGLHTTRIVPDNGSMTFRSRWAVGDVDHHAEGPAPPENEAAAIAWYSKLKALGHDCLLEDSNGRGGFHLWAIFKDSIPTEIAKAFFDELMANWKELGLKTKPEVFPKQVEVGSDGFGNWVRLPGRHPKHPDHWSRIFDGEDFVEGDAAINLIETVRPIVLTDGDYERIRSFQQAERTDPEGVVPAPKPELQAPNRDLRPGDDFEAKVDWESILCLHGWKKDEVLQNGEVRWTRPGKNGGSSATTGRNKGLHVFTDSAEAKPFEADGNYSKFEAFALLNHGGDRHAAANALSEAGYGSQPKRCADPKVMTNGKANRKANLICFDKVQEKPVEWLWYPRLPLGMICLFAGTPKVGKTFATIAIAAAVSRGAPLPLDEVRGAGSVILLSAEDDPAKTLKPRLRAAGADMSKVHFLKSMLLQDGNEALPSLRCDLEAIEVAAKALGDCKLIIIDPVTAYLDGVDDHRAGEIRGLLYPLSAMAEALNVTIILVTHLSKSLSQDAQQRVLGSVSYVAACRVNFLFAKDKDDPAKRRRLMLELGGNLTEEVPTLGYRIADSGEGPQIEWEQDTTPITAEEILAEEPPCEREDHEEAEECREWLRLALTQGRQSQKELARQGREDGFSESMLRRAKKRIGAKSRRIGFGKTGNFEWFLPEHDHASKPSIDDGSPP